MQGQHLAWLQRINISANLPDRIFQGEEKLLKFCKKQEVELGGSNTICTSFLLYFN